MFSKYGNCTRLLKIKTSWKSVVFTNKVGKNSRYFLPFFIQTSVMHVQSCCFAYKTYIIVFCDVLFAVRVVES